MWLRLEGLFTNRVISHLIKQTNGEQKTTCAEKQLRSTCTFRIPASMRVFILVLTLEYFLSSSTLSPPSSSPSWISDSRQDAYWSCSCWTSDVDFILFKRMLAHSFIDSFPSFHASTMSERGKCWKRSLRVLNLGLESGMFLREQISISRN